MSDEFNSTVLDSKWHEYYCFEGVGDIGCYGDGGMHPNHCTVSGGALVLKLDSLDDPWDGITQSLLWAAGIRTNNFDYTYGYLEMRAKLPGYERNNEPCGYGFWPTFWTYYEEVDNGCLIKLDEIDILEPSGSQYSDGRTNVYGWHDEIGNCSRSKVSGSLYYTHDEPLYDSYHSYAIEWLPERIIFYFDNDPIFMSYDNNTVPDNPQRVLISFQLGGGGTWPYSNTPLPQYMYVDYFRFYELKHDCNTDATILNNTQLSSFDFQVKKTVTIGDGSSSISLSSGDHVTFRATDEITINGEFTVPIGSELNIIPTPCNY